MGKSTRQPEKQQQHLSEEFVYESDNEENRGANGDIFKANRTHKDDQSDDSDNSAVENEVAKKKTSLKRATSQGSAPDLESQSESSSDNASEAADSDLAQDHVTDKGDTEPELDTAAESDADGSESDGTDSDGSDTSKSSSKRSREDATNIENEQTKRRKTRNEGPVKITSKEFSPPQGFHPLILGASDFASDSAEILSDLNGKQVWHISAPASLNISSIKSLDLEAVMKGETIVTKDGISYSMQESNPQHETLMLVEGRSARYEPSPTKVSRSFKLGVRSNKYGTDPSLQNTDQESPKKAPSTFVAQSPGEKNAPRAQPKGLSGRYQPFGSETMKQQALNVSSPTKMTPLRSRPIASARRSTGNRIVVADPMLATIVKSKDLPKYTPKPLIFSTPRVNDADVEMEDAPSPSKEANISKVGMKPASSKVVHESKTTGATPEASGQVKVKKSKSKLVDGGGL